MNASKIIQSIWLLAAVGFTLMMLHGFNVTVDFRPVVDWVMGL